MASSEGFGGGGKGDGSEGKMVEEYDEREAEKRISWDGSRRRWAAGSRAGYSEIESEGRKIESEGRKSEGIEDGVRDTGRSSRQEERLRQNIHR